MILQCFINWISYKDVEFDNKNVYFRMGTLSIDSINLPTCIIILWWNIFYIFIARKLEDSKKFTFLINSATCFKNYNIFNKLYNADDCSDYSPYKWYLKNEIFKFKKHVK